MTKTYHVYNIGFADCAKKLQYYLTQIDAADDMQTLNDLVEIAAFDVSLTNRAYEMIFKTAVETAQERRF